MLSIRRLPDSGAGLPAEITDEQLPPELQFRKGHTLHLVLETHRKISEVLGKHRTALKLITRLRNQPPSFDPDLRTGQN